MSNSHHLQNYHDHHLHAIYVLVLFDWCHFVWNFPYGFIVHIFVSVNGSIAMCWAEAIVYLTISDSIPWVVCSLKLFCGAHLWKKCLHELVGFLCFLKSARWTCGPADGLTRPEDDAFSARLAFLSWVPRHGVCSKVGNTPLLFVSHLWESARTSLILCSLYVGKNFGPKPCPHPFPVSSCDKHLCLMVWRVRERPA